MSTTTRAGFDRLQGQLGEIQAALGELGLDGWLFYELKGRNPIAVELVGVEAHSRRYFVWVPATGAPVAIVHGIETGPWAAWPWTMHRYAGWRELDQLLEGTLHAGGRVAMEVMPRDAVPVVDLVPAGVVELVRATGVEVVPSGELITRFYSRWSSEQLASHRRAAEVLAEVAKGTFERIARAVAAGKGPGEVEARRWVIEQLQERGCGVGADCIVATGVNAADPHYEAVGEGATFRAGDMILLDLWAKEGDELIYADQTWIAYLGETVPARLAEVWDAARAARDAAVSFLRERWREGRAVQGFEVDDVARGEIDARGFGRAFIHRTGHSIDRATHGMGPNIDNYETHEVRTLIPGVGFSIEPGIYLPGEIGLRTEINVYIGEDGPEVTPHQIQHEVWAYPVG